MSGSTSSDFNTTGKNAVLKAVVIENIRKAGSDDTPKPLIQ